MTISHSMLLLVASVLVELEKKNMKKWIIFDLKFIFSPQMVSQLWKSCLGNDVGCMNLSTATKSELWVMVSTSGTFDNLFEIILSHRERIYNHCHFSFFYYFERSQYLPVFQYTDFGEGNYINTTSWEPLDKRDSSVANHKNGNIFRMTIAKPTK